MDYRDLYQKENVKDYYKQGKSMSAYELTSAVYRSGSLQRIKLAPTTKLVLMALTNHYNPAKADMFPSQKYLAVQLGIGTRSVARAIDELRKKGLVIYETKTVNRYRFTNTFFSLVSPQGGAEKKFSTDKLADSPCQNDTKEYAKMANKQIKEKEKNNPHGGNLNFQKNEQSWSQQKFKNNFYNNKASSFSDYKNRKQDYNQQQKGVQYTTYKPERVQKGSPLDFSREQAIEYLASLPQFMKDCHFARELRKKWGL